MKRTHYLILFLGLLTLTSVGARAGQISNTVTYDPSKLSITYDTINGTAYAIVNYELFNSSDSVSKPQLPSDVFTLSVPYNSSNYSVQCQINSYVEVNVSGGVFPCQIPRAICDTTELFTLPDTLVYQSDTYYPYNECRVSEPYFLSGCNKVVNLIVSPVKYNPVLNKLLLATSITVTLSYDIDSNIAPIMASNNLEQRERDRSRVESCVKNKMDVAGNEAPITINNPEPNTSLPTYSYCILTDKNLEPAFKKIIAMKRQKGLSAGTVCVEDIIDSGLFPDGDKCYDNNGNLISVIPDTAGVVRQYLKYAYRADVNPTRYLLIGGKSHNIPIRYVKSLGKKREEQHVPTDMYFSDLGKIWKKYYSQDYDNEYMVYGQNNQGSDNYGALSYSPMIFVGRLPATEINEINNYSDKLYRYTMEPCHDDCDYLLRAFFSNSHGKFMKNESDTAIFYANQLFNTVTLVEQSDNSIYPTGADIVSELNNTKYGYMSFYAHGDPQSIAVYDNVTTYRRHVLSALDSDISIYPTREEIGNGLDCLLNKYQPAVGYSIACETAPYDNPDTLYTLTYKNKYNFGESFILGKNYGGVAYLGNTRSGYIDISYLLESDLLKTLINTFNYKIGVIEAFSKILYRTKSSEYYRHVMLTHNLLGDPEFEIWTSAPLQYSGISVARLDNGFRISGVSSIDTIAFCDNYGHQGTIVGSENNSMFISAHPSSTLMVFNHDHIPYIAPMMLQNCEISNSQYVYASSFSAGKAILPNNTHGNVTIKSGAVYEVEGIDDVHLGEGFIVENGATFAIKTPGKVTIDGCAFLSGANVKIEAGSVEIVKSFTSEFGSKVEITQFVE